MKHSILHIIVIAITTNIKLLSGVIIKEFSIISVPILQLYCSYNYMLNLVDNDI